MTRTASKQSTAATALNFAVIAEHPTRLKCWSLLAERTMSPKELAEETGLSLSHLAYHVRVLRDLGAIELVKTEPRRGATGHWYRSVARPDLREAEVGTLSDEESNQNAAHIAQLEVADMAASLEAGKMVERPDHALIRFPLDLDEEGFAELSRLMDETLDRIYEIQETTVSRTEGAPEERSIPAMAHLNLFEIPQRQRRPETS